MMITPEFSRLVPLERIGVKEKSFAIDANPQECVALAERLGIPRVMSAHADITLKLVRGGKLVALKGRLQAELEQICVVTLEPVTNRIDEEFSRFYSVEAEPDAGEVVIDLNEEEPPDPIEHGQIDIGEAAAEHLALAMDPFPRAPGVAFEPAPEAAEPGAEEEARPNPFAVLAEHRKKL
jgi:uncharacterized metal-binding protein YceD (DUF177 family)